MPAFFSPKSRLHVSRRLAIPLNTMNLLGPVLLFGALFLLAVAGFGDGPPAVQHWLLTRAGALIATALLLRITWGIALFRLKRRQP